MTRRYRVGAGIAALAEAVPTLDTVEPRHIALAKAEYDAMRTCDLEQVACDRTTSEWAKELAAKIVAERLQTR